MKLPQPVIVMKIERENQMGKKKERKKNKNSEMP
jgi:hypothetical protein